MRHFPDLGHQAACDRDPKKGKYWRWALCLPLLKPWSESPRSSMRQRNSGRPDWEVQTGRVCRVGSQREEGCTETELGRGGKGFPGSLRLICTNKWGHSPRLGKEPPDRNTGTNVQSSPRAWNSCFHPPKKKTLYSNSWYWVLKTVDWRLLWFHLAKLIKQA